MKVARAVVLGLMVFTLAAMALYALAVLGVFPDGSLLSGASFLPSSWLTPVVILVLGAGWTLGRQRLAVAVGVSFLIVALLAGDYSLRARPTPVAERGKTISVVALNVRYYSFGRTEVLRALNEIGADVALLSENVLTPEQAEQMRQDALPAHFRMGRTEETAILSRFPILEFKEVDLPSHQASLWGPSSLNAATERPRRSFTHAVVDAHGVPVHVISIRLIAGRPPAKDLWSQIQWGQYLLETQADEVAFFEDYVRKLKGPFVFGGDLNATPPSFAVRRLAELADDSYLALNPLGSPTFRVALPIMRLDYLFASKDLVPVRAEHLDVVVSDHFPVIAEYQLPAASATPEP